LGIAFRKFGLGQGEKRSVRLLVAAPVITSMFFRPEEDSLVSIVVNDIRTAKCCPINVGLENQW